MRLFVAACLPLLFVNTAWAQVTAQPPPVAPQPAPTQHASTPIVEGIDDQGMPVQQVPPPPPPAPAEAPAKKSKVKIGEGDMGTMVVQVGIRGMAQDVRGTDHDGLIAGAGLGAWIFANFGVKSLSLRLESRSHLGGSGGGFDGQYGGDISAGGRLGLGESFALLARIGASGHILGNGRLLWWGVALPETDVGLQVGHGRFFFETTGLAGITLGGNYLAGDDGQRKIGTAPHLGARATLGLRPLVATVTWRHIFEGQHAPETPLDSVDGGLCLVFGKLAGVALCGDGRVMRGQVGFPNGAFSESTVLYGGISLSLGAILSGSGPDANL